MQSKAKIKPYKSHKINSQFSNQLKLESNNHCLNLIQRIFSDVCIYLPIKEIVQDSHSKNKNLTLKIYCYSEQNLKLQRSEKLWNTVAIYSVSCTPISFLYSARLPRVQDMLLKTRCNYRHFLLNINNLLRNFDRLVSRFNFNVLFHFCWPL